MKQVAKNCFFVCATEQSGDNIGEKLMSQIKLKINNTVFDGVGGNKMRNLLSKQYFSLKDFKSIGIIEIFGSINKYLYMINALSKIILKNNYKFVITIDSPDFNFRLAKKIKNKGFKGKIVHIVNLVDRSPSGIDFGYPSSALLKLPSESWDPDNCPLCKQDTPLIERGRTGKKLWRQNE